MLPGDPGERLVRPLDDPLGADVDPGAGGHLSVHREAHRLEAPELFPRGPLGHQHGVGDENPRRPFVRAEDAHRLPGLDQECFVGREHAQRGDDGVERPPGPRGLPLPSVDDQVVRLLGDVGIQIVHQHPQRRFLGPSPA